MSLALPLADIGVKALYLLFIWLASCIVAAWLSDRKGYGERPGLATGLLLSAIAIPIWLLWPAKSLSAWKREGMLPKRAARRTPGRSAVPEGDGGDADAPPPDA
ncbi:MAG: hypothetical protein U0T02_08900 [Solirubrobacteraceae bacterium]